MKVKHFLTAAVATTAFACAAIAGVDTFTWNGSQSNDWFDHQNWTGPANEYPINQDHEVIIQQAGNHQPTLDFDKHPNKPDDVTIGSLVVQTSGILTVVNNLASPNNEKLLITSAGALNGSATVMPTGQVVLQKDAYVDVVGPVAIEASSINRGEVRLEHNDALLQINDKLVIMNSNRDRARLRVGTTDSGGAGGTVRFTSAQTHDIGGLVDLMDEMSRIEIRANTTFAPHPAGTGAGVGDVRGLDNAAKILICEGFQLVNQIVMKGGMVVEPMRCGSLLGSSPAVFRNQRVDANGQAWNQVLTGIVRAEELVAGQGTLELAEELKIEDESFYSGVTYRPSWEARGSGAVLKFSNTAGECGTDPLVGNFVIEDAVLCLAFARTEELHTAGNLELPGISWEVRSPNFDPKEEGPCFIYECSEAECATDEC